MGSVAIKLFTKDFKIIFLFVIVLFLSAEMTSGIIVKKSDIINKNYCRSHIFHPRCRGQQKRDVVSRPSEELRLAPLEAEFPVLERHDITSILNSPTLLGELLRKAIDSAYEYDTENGNYLK